MLVNPKREPTVGQNQQVLSGASSPPHRNEDSPPLNKHSDIHIRHNLFQRLIIIGGIFEKTFTDLGSLMTNFPFMVYSPSFDDLVTCKLNRKLNTLIGGLLVSPRVMIPIRFPVDSTSTALLIINSNTHAHTQSLEACPICSIN